MVSKLLLIGLDGATWDLIKPWAEEGKLPTFKKLMENGVWGYLESTYPPWTSPAWESMCTGKNPATLDAGMFLVRKNGSFIPISYIVEKVPKIWDLLSFKGIKVCVANVPCLIRPYEINGYLVVGFLYKDENKITYPPSLIEELDEIANGYQIDIVKTGKTGLSYVPPREKIFEESENLFEKHFKAFKYLLLEKDWDFAFIVFVTPDRIQHKLWDKKDIILKHFQHIDKRLSELIESLKDVNIFLVSDHGFGKVEYSFRINDWLIKEGYLKLKVGVSQSKFVKVLKYIKLKKIAEKIAKKLPEKIMARIFKKVIKNFFEVEVDWTNTKAFSYGGMGEIYINLKKRYSDGYVNLEEYDKLREEIIEKIKKLRNPLTGEKLKVKIFKKEEIYPNTKPEDSVPHIIILPTDDGIHAFSSAIGYDEIFSTVSRNNGNHRLYGIFLAYGPDIKTTGEEIKNVKIYDIAPTILHMFGLPVPKDMDGRVLKEIFREDSEIAKREVVYVEPSYYEKRIKRMKIGGISEKERIREKIKMLKRRQKI